MARNNHPFALVLALSLVLTAALSVGCVQNTAVTGVSLDVTTLSLKVGESKQLQATIVPADAANPEVSWMTSNPSIATINEGLVTAVGEGSAVITVTAADGGWTATCNVTVSSVEVKVKKVVMNFSDTTISIGASLDLVASVIPSNATQRALTWTKRGDDTSAISISRPVGSTSDSVMTVTGISEGKARVVATTASGYWASCNVTVTKAYVPITDFSVSPTSLSVSINQSSSISASILPTNATDKTVTWTSDDPLTATVDKYGNVTGVSKGSATITAVPNDNKALAATCTVTVLGYANVTNISLSKSSATLNIGRTDTVTFTVTPSYAHDKSVSCTSSDPSVASVSMPASDRFVVKALKAGTATVTAKANDEGGKYSNFSVTVLKDTVKVASVSMNSKDTVLNFTKSMADSLKLTATVYPVDATDQRLIWTSSNAMVAFVRQNGMVIAIGEGRSDIVVRSNENIYCTDTCHLTVRHDTIYVEKVTLSESPVTNESARLYSGQTVSLTATLAPSNANYLNALTWQSASSEVGVSVSPSNDRRATATVVNAGNLTSSVGISAASQNGVTGSANVNFGRIAVFSSYGEVTDTLECEVDSSYSISCKWNRSSSSYSDVPSADVSWLTDAPTVAYVSNGSLVCLKTGTAKISARVGLVTVYADVKVVDKSFKVKSVSVFPTSVYIAIDSTAQLTAYVKPAYALNKKVYWSSFDPAIASVDTNGLVRGIAVGSTTVSATTADGGFTASCKVNVSDSITHVKGVRFTTDSVTVMTTLTHTLSVLVTPVNATTKDVMWSVSDGSIAKISETGFDSEGMPYCTILGVKPGLVKLEVITEDGGYKASIPVRVTLLPVDVSKVTVVAATQSSESSRLYPGQTVRLVASYEPKDANRFTAMKWVSDNSSAVGVVPDSTGALTATATVVNSSNSSGLSVVSVSSGNGFKDNAIIYYGKIVIAIDGKQAGSTKVYANTKTQLQCLYESSTGVFTAVPASAVKWSSSNTSYAEVTSTGLVTTKTPFVKNDVIATVGGVSASITFDIDRKWISVTGVSLTPSSIDAVQDSSYSIDAVVSPTDADDKKVTWTSSDTTVATVAGGIVTCKKATGSTTVTATTEDGGYKATCIVTVSAKVLSFTLDHTATDSTRAYTGQAVTITPVFYPSYATEGTEMSWKVSNSRYATITMGGVLTITNALNYTSYVTVEASTDDGLEASTNVYFGKVRLYDGSTEIEDLKAVKMTVGDTLKLSVKYVKDSSGGLGECSGVTWTAPVPGVLSVDGNGLVTAKGVSTSATVTASVGSVTLTFYAYISK
jgi:uncharacterized protein YjdB